MQRGFQAGGGEVRKENCQGPFLTPRPATDKFLQQVFVITRRLPRSLRYASGWWPALVAGTRYPNSRPMLEVVFSMVLATLVPHGHSQYDPTYANVMRRHGHEALLRDLVCTMSRRRRLSPSTCSVSDMSPEVVTGFLGQYFGGANVSCTLVAAASMCTRDTLPLCPVSCGACPSYTFTEAGVVALTGFQLAGAGAPLGAIAAGEDVTDAHQATILQYAKQSIEQSVALGWAVGAITADLSGFCDCFTQGWSQSGFTPLHCWQTAGTLLPIAGASCGAPWYRDMSALPNNVADWSAEVVLSWTLMGGSALGLDKEPRNLALTPALALALTLALSTPHPNPRTSSSTTF